MPDYLYDLKERLISWPKILKNNHKLQNLPSNFHKKVHLSPFMPHCWILPNANFRIISTLFTTSPSIYLLQYFISEGKSWITKHFIFQGCALALEKFGSLKQKHFSEETLCDDERFGSRFTNFETFSIFTFFDVKMRRKMTESNEPRKKFRSASLTQHFLWDLIWPKSNVRPVSSIHLM